MTPEPHATDRPDAVCLGCGRPREYRDTWPGEIKGRFGCLRCALTVVRFWQDGDTEGVSREQAVSGVPLANPRQYHHRRSDKLLCAICGAPSVTEELNYERAFCGARSGELGRDIAAWRELKR